MISEDKLKDFSDSSTKYYSRIDDCWLDLLNFVETIKDMPLKEKLEQHLRNMRYVLTRNLKDIYNHANKIWEKNYSMQQVRYDLCPLFEDSKIGVGHLAELDDILARCIELETDAIETLLGETIVDGVAMDYYAG